MPQRIQRRRTKVWRNAFGTRLRPAGPPLTEQQIRDRNNDTHAAYVRQAMTRRTP